MTADATRVADALAAGYATSPEAAKATLDSLFADEVELRHVPALGSDGRVDGAKLAEGTNREAAAITSVITDLHHEDVEVVAEGDRVHVTASICGTLATGKAVRLLSDMWCTVHGGRIVGLEHRMDDDVMAAWLEVAVAGGLMPPAPASDEVV